MYSYRSAIIILLLSLDIKFEHISYYLFPIFHDNVILHKPSLDVTWSPTASYIVTASDDKTLRLWSAETGDAFVEFRGHASFVFSCKFNPQSNLLVSGVSTVAMQIICCRRLSTLSSASSCACVTYHG